MTLEAPLIFKTRPAALRVRIAPSHPGASPSTFEPDTFVATVAALVCFIVKGGVTGEAQASQAG